MIRFASFAELLGHMAASSPDKPALVSCADADGVRETTWAELSSLVNARAEELKSSGCACEAVLADGSVECVVETFAAVQAGLQVALVDPLMPNAVLAPLLQSVDADSVWTPSESRQRELAQLLAPKAAPAYGAGTVLFFTSGTTSAAKAVALTDAGLMASAFNGSSLLPLSLDDTLLCLLPLPHVFGFVCGLLWGLACGATVALGRGARHYADDFALFAPTAVAVVPKMLQYLLARAAFNDALKLVLVGAADCPDETLDAVRRLGIRASLGYGLTETSSGVALSIGDDFHAMTICPDDAVTIADDGEVLVSAPTCLMQGYYRDSAKTAAAVRDGVLHTGDRGFLDDEGRLHVKGRLKDVLTLPGGTKVYLPEYEAAVSKALGERDIAVALCQNTLTLVCGELACQRSDQELSQAMEPALSFYPPGMRIGRIVRLGHALPRTAAGDVERWKIQEEMKHGNR